MSDRTTPELLRTTRDQVVGLREARSTAKLALADATAAWLAARSEAQRLTELGQGADAALATVAAAAAQRSALLGRLATFDADELVLIGALSVFDPCDAEADVPLVLLPVRIETRYSADLGSLRVRIFPDEAHLDRLDEGLKESERVAAEAYWRRIWTGGGSVEEAAWRSLVAAIRPDRAAWAVDMTRPANLADRPADEALGGGVQPQFPAMPVGSGGPVIARGLPDRFVVTVVQGSQVERATGNAVPPELVVSVPRTGDEPPPIYQKLDLPIGPGMEWLVDPDVAEASGMAITVPLPVPGGAIDRVIVTGLRTSLGADAGARELEDLLRAHRYSTGLAFVPQGTSTNNREGARSPWTKGDVPLPGPTRPSPEPAPEVNSRRMAAALGIDPTVLDGVRDGDLHEDADARAAHTALWATSWGAFFDRLVVVGRHGRSVPDLVREWARDLFTEHVRGRGPLPVLRIGAQPYGVLPVAAVDRHWRTTDATESGLVDLLRRARPLWRGGLPDVPRLDGSSPLDETLLEILGSSAVMLGLRVRSVASETTMSFTGPLIGDASDENPIVQQQLDRLLWATLGFDPSGIYLNGALGTATRPLGLPLVAESDVAYIASVLDPNVSGPGQVESVLQALLHLAAEAEERAVSSAGPPERIAGMVERATEVVADASVVSTLQSVVGEVVSGGADRVRVAESLSAIDARVEPAGLGLLSDFQPLAAIRGSLAEVAEQPDLEPALSAKIALQVVGAFLRGTNHVADFNAAIGALARTTLEQRHLLVAEALDCASHRLDAWITALASKRLGVQRRLAPTGSLLGAYGWVEGLEPGTATSRDGGYVHAPSVGHAATAGILRNAYLTHNPDAGGSGAFAIDLSSARVRSALRILEGIGQGQPLGALLGYQFERRLHDEGLDRFIRSFRTIAPIVGGKLTDRADAVPQQAQEAIAANNVVDGVRLLAVERPAILAALANKPADNPYLVGEWTGPVDNEATVIGQLLDELAAELDAVSDVLLAEGVHQLVGGNMDRAAAALESTSGGNAPPADPDVVRTPVRGVSIGHRMLMLLDASASGTTGWAEDQPRAMAEPRLESWAARRLGPASAIVVGQDAAGDELTIDTAGLCALDLVGLSGSPELLVARLHDAFPGIDAARLRADLVSREAPPVSPGRVFWTAAVDVAAAVGRVIAASTPAGRGAFARPSDPLGRRIDRLEIGRLAERITSASAGLGAAADALSGAVGDAGDAGDGQPEGAPAAAAPSTPQAIAARRTLAAYGVALPAANHPPTVETDRALVAEARRRLVLASAALARLQAQETEAVTREAAELGEGDVAILTGHRNAAAAARDGAALSADEAGRALFGDAFRILPVIAPGLESDLFASAIGTRLATASQVRRFVADAASVREPMDRYADVLLHADALGRPARLQAVQLATPGTPGSSRWIALDFDPDEPSPTAPITSIVVDAPDGLALDGSLAGLVIDEWSEVVPARVEHASGTRDSAEKVREALVTTGLAVNANGPDARAPQAILLAVSPDGERWSTDRLVDTLEETLELAKLRLVSLERVALAGRVLPALQVNSWSLQGDEPALDLSTIVSLLADESKMVRFVKE